MDAMDFDGVPEPPMQEWPRDNLITSIPIELPPKAKWNWDVFGGKILTVEHHSLNPSLWRRMMTRLFLGSKWTRL